MTTTQMHLYEARRAVQILGEQIDGARAAGAEPSARIVDAHTELNDLAFRQAVAVRELADAYEPNSPQSALALVALADKIVDGSATSEQVSNLLVRQAADVSRSLSSLKNAVAHRFNSRADAVLRSLGDELITGLLDPWSQALLGQLRPLAQTVVDFGAGTVPYGHDIAEAHSKATAIVEALEGVRVHARAFRRHAVVPGQSDDIDPRLFIAKHPHRLLAEERQHRQPYATCFELLDGAALGVYTASQARSIPLPA